MSKSIASPLITIMQILSDGAFHSGSDIGTALGISRAAIWKYMQQLSALGVEILTTTGKGYCLTQPLVLLNSKKIKEHIGTAAVMPTLPDIIGNCPLPTPWPIGNITVYENAASTQDLARLAPITPELSCYLAEYQTAGRGRFGRSWHAPFGSICLSCSWSIERDISELNGLSVALSLAILHALQAHGIPDLSVKWPNDIVWHGKKLAGILIEIDAISHSDTRVIIGIGINANLPKTAAQHIQRPFASLNHILGQPQDRNLLAARIITALSWYLSLFATYGLQYFLPIWQKHDFLYGQEITLQMGKQQQTGIMRGISEQGLLLLQHANGTISMHSAGEASLSRMLK